MCVLMRCHALFSSYQVACMSIAACEMRRLMVIMDSVVAFARVIYIVSDIGGDHAHVIHDCGSVADPPVISNVLGSVTTVSTTTHTTRCCGFSSTMAVKAGLEVMLLLSVCHVIGSAYWRRAAQCDMKSACR